MRCHSSYSNLAQRRVRQYFHDIEKSDKLCYKYHIKYVSVPNTVRSQSDPPFGIRHFSLSTKTNVHKILLYTKREMDERIKRKECEHFAAGPSPSRSILQLLRIPYYRIIVKNLLRLLYICMFLLSSMNFYCRILFYFHEIFAKS